MKPIALWLSLGAAAAAAQIDPSPLEYGGMRGRVLGHVSEEVARNGEGSTIRLKDGALYHLMSRHLRPSPEEIKKQRNHDLWPAVIARTISRDGGLTWSEPETVFRSNTGPNAMQPSLARLANGEIGVSYSKINGPMSATKVFRYSADEGQTWSEEILISPEGAYWTSAHDRMITLSTGRVLLTLHNKESLKPERMVTQVAYSDDHGRTWKLSPNRIVVEDMLPAHRAKYGARSGFWEASIAERADGSLFMIGRTYAGRLYASTSNDKGVTWSKPSPTSLPSGAAPGRIERIPGSSDLLVVWNSCCIEPGHPMVGRRLTLAAAISTDGGKTWKWERSIEEVTPGAMVDYPAVNIWDQKVYITYRAWAPLLGDKLRLQEYLSILPLEWFYAKKDHQTLN